MYKNQALYYKRHKQEINRKSKEYYQLHRKEILQSRKEQYLKDLPRLKIDLK